MKDIITKLYFFKTTNPEIKAELDSLVGVSGRTVERLELFNKFEKGEIEEDEYLSNGKAKRLCPFC